MGALFSLSQVQKSYAGRRVTDIESLEILQGEILAVVGPSGAGKSTLLRLLNFLEEADSGQLLYEGRPVSPALPLSLRRQVTTVFQRPALLNDTVRANVVYGLAVRGLRGEDAGVQAILSRMGLEHLARARARTLSGGEMQRVALARALVVRPRVLLLDEPTANLDPYNGAMIETVVREANREHGTTVVLVTHNVFQARRLAQRAALLLAGQVIETGRAADFFDNPVDARTRAFINGEMIY